VPAPAYPMEALSLEKIKSIFNDKEIDNLVFCGPFKEKIDFSPDVNIYVEQNLLIRGAELAYRKYLQEDFISLEELEPIYIRKSDAEIMKEKKEKQ